MNIQELKDQNPQIELSQDEDQKVKGGTIVEDIIGF